MFPGAGFWGAIGRIASKHIKVVAGTRSFKSRPKISNCKDEEESMNATENESDQEEMDTKEGMSYNDGLCLALTSTIVWFVHIKEARVQ